jgi:hypothetical protein
MNGVELPIVVIIDREPKRRSEMANAFKGSASIQFVYRPISGKRFGRDSPELVIETAEGVSITNIGPALIALRHIRDKQLVPDLAAYLTVYYGGNGGYDDDCPSDAQERIWRPVNPGSGTLTSDEANSLFSYVISKKIGKEDVVRPSFLIEPPVYDILPALAILCQGFLAVFAEQIVSPISEYSETLKLAFKLMGWSEIMHNHDPILLLIRSKIIKGKENVTQVNWWLKVFNILDEELIISKEKMAKFKQKLEDEWEKTYAGKLPNQIEELFHLLSTEPRLNLTEDNVELVAKVYCLITQNLSSTQPIS